MSDWILQRVALFKPECNGKLVHSKDDSEESSVYFVKTSFYIVQRDFDRTWKLLKNDSEN